MNAKKQNKGPSFVAKSGIVGVPIYTIMRGHKSEHYAVCYYEGGQRQRRYFVDFEKAKREAGIIAAKISRGDLEAIRLTGIDRQAYATATELLKPTGANLVSAVQEYAAAHVLLNGSPLLEAVRFYADHRNGLFSPAKVSKVKTELIEFKENKGRSLLYIKDLNYRLNLFSGAFADRDIHGIKTHEMEKWLHKLKLSPRSINNFLTAIRTLFTFAASRHYLPKGHPGASEIEEATEPEKEILIFTPDEMTHLLNHARPEIIPFLVLGAFGGIRSAEIQRLSWTDVKWEQGVIEIKCGKAKTRARRLVTLDDSLRAWLLPHARKSGAIVPFVNLVNQIKWLAEAVDANLKKENPGASFKWKANGLRHSFVSYKLAQTDNENLVARECGNSPSIIYKHYRALVSKAEAERWFAIRPVRESNILDMPKTAAAS